MSIETDQLLGTDLAGYRIESVLGRGGMGIVYLATDLRLERKVALKLVAPELAADLRFSERFLRESRLAASLDHSHVVPVYAAGDLDGQLWIAMRYVQGTDLRTLLEHEAPLDPARAVELCCQIGEALDAAHAHGLVHRDVKPANVLVTQEGGAEHCYLADFGLARTADLEAGPGSAAHLSGTVDYTAPEQIAREPADQRADVYSLGCVLHECLTGQPPFKRPRAVATLFAHASEPPPSPHEKRPELPEAIDTVIANGLAKDPGERYETCGELCRAAETALGLGMPRFTRRRLVLAGTGAAIAVAAAAAVPAVLLTRRDRTAVPPPAILPVAEDSLIRIDPQTGDAIAAIPIKGRPAAVAVGEESVWLIDGTERTLARIDPQQNSIAQTVRLPASENTPGVEAGDGIVWLNNGELKYDPISGSLSKTELIGLLDVAAGAGACWVTDYRALYRLDPKTGAVQAEIFRLPEAEAGAIWVAVGEGAIWAASLRGLVHRVDPGTNMVSETRNADHPLYGIAAGEGAAWALASDDDLILRIDPATLAVTNRVRVGRSPTTVVTGAGAVWVNSERDGTVTRIDPDTANIETIDIGGTPTDIAVGPGALWVAVDVR